VRLSDQKTYQEQATELRDRLGDLSELHAWISRLLSTKCSGSKQRRKITHRARTLVHCAPETARAQTSSCSARPRRPRRRARPRAQRRRAAARSRSARPRARRAAAAGPRRWPARRAPPSPAGRSTRSAGSSGTPARPARPARREGRCRVQELLRVVRGRHAVGAAAEFRNSCASCTSCAPGPPWAPRRGSGTPARPARPVRRGRRGGRLGLHCGAVPQTAPSRASALALAPLCVSAKAGAGSIRGSCRKRMAAVTGKATKHLGGTHVRLPFP